MSTEESPQNVNRVRTSDAEREQVAEALRNAVTEGRLNLEEGDERLAALYQTKFRDELPPLVADLPAGRAWTTPAPAAGSGAGSDGSENWGGRGRRGWGPGPGGPGGWGPGPGGPGGWGSGPGSFGPPSGGPTGGVDPRMWRRRHMFRGIRFAVIIAALIAFTVITGHFFWPIIPLFFLFQFLRFGAMRRRAMWGGGWGGPGCGHHGYGPGYGDDSQSYGGRGPGAV